MKKRIPFPPALPSIMEKMAIVKVLNLFKGPRLVSFSFG